MDISQASESNVSTEAVTSTPDVSNSAPDISADVPASTGEQTPPAYQPNFKYKVHDKEYEFDDFVRGAIKDAESEKKLRELYERSKGLDEIKSKRDKLNEEYTSYKKSAEPVMGIYNNAAVSYQKALEAMKKGDNYGAAMYFDEAFGALGVSEDVLMKHVYNKLQIKDLPPQLQQQYTRMSELERQNFMLQQQMEQAETSRQQLTVQQRQFELQQTLAKPEVTAIQQSFDQRNGQNGFFSAVWNFAGLHYQRTGVDLSADQAAQMFIEQFGLTAPAAPQVPTQPQVITQGNVPVIPNVKGGGSINPAKKKVSSIADIEAEYQKLR